MRRRIQGFALIACATALAAAVGSARATPVIPWQDAGLFAGDLVTVEGDVQRARLEGGALVLEFAPDDAAAFRVVLVIPLITDLPRQPQRLYEGKRVQVTGTVRRFSGKSEMIVRSPDAIEVVGVATNAPPDTPPAAATVTTTTRPPPTVTTTTSPPPPTTLPPAAPPPPPSAAPTVSATPIPAPAVHETPISAAPPPRSPPSSAPAAPPAAAPTAEEDEPLRLPSKIDPCEVARERWRRAAAALETRAADLTRCLGAGTYRCREAASGMGAPLVELEWAEQQVEAACP